MSSCRGADHPDKLPQLLSRSQARTARPTTPGYDDNLDLHGWYSIPGGVKPTFLAQHCQEVLTPALPDDDFDAAHLRFSAVEALFNGLVAQYPGSTWLFGNVYDPWNDFQPLGWWE